MVAKLGEIFYQQASEPLARALAVMREEPLEQALEVLAGERLIGAFRSGTEQVAKKAGVSALRVFRLLDMDLVDEIVQRVDVGQRFAVSMWRTHDAGDGGLFSDQALLGDGELATAIAGLRRIASTLSREEQVSTAFTALADELDRWTAMLDEARTRIERAHPLERAYGRRRMAFAAVIAVLISLTLAGGGWLVGLYRVRAKVDAQLKQASCAVAIDPADAARASDAQRDAMRAAREACEKEQAEAAREAEERRKAEDRKREQEKLAKARRERCERFAANFKAGKLDAADKKEAGAQATLLQRLIDERLELDDLSNTEGPLPCADGEAGKAIRLALAALVVTKMLKWIQTQTPSQFVMDAIVEHKDVLPAHEKTLLAGHIEMTAKRAVLTGQKPDVDRFAKLCRMSFALVDKKGVNCVAVLELAKQAAQ